ncbi:MAG TPA: glutamate-1-semialdehyde 2,1-aminomutase [Candidatus Dormibacteraeota bacterium]
MKDAQATALRERAERVLAGGVNSPVRAFRAVPGTPPAIVRGEGAYLYDADGNRFIDCILAYGPHILGHNPPEVLAAVRAQLDRGIAFGTTTLPEVELAERIVDAVPSIELVRFVNSGTEATMSAIRLARAATGRDGIVKFDGAYHGHADALLAGAGSGVATLGIPGSPGVPEAAVAATTVLPYNDADAVADLLTRRGEQIAAVLVEPVAGNMGCVPPLAGYLQRLRALTREHGCLLIFDEVMTGFRIAYGGAQSLYSVTPDLTCLGKIIGAGLPVGAYGGSRTLMEKVAPSGPVYQAGTLSGNPLAMAAGGAALDRLRDGAQYDRLEQLGRRLADGFAAAAASAGIECAINRVGSMITPFLRVERVVDFAAARRASRTGFARLHQTWLETGVLWPPSQYEAGFLSTVHTDQDVDRITEMFAGGVVGAERVRAR